MTLKGLKEKVDFFYNMGERYHYLEVCIPNEKGGMGGTPVTKVKSVNKGIDWDNGKFFIFPEVKMIEQ